MNELANILSLSDLELEILHDYENYTPATDKIYEIVRFEAARRLAGKTPITGAMVAEYMAKIKE
jgi:hypothetical protein